jgi:hypothetical protein
MEDPIAANRELWNEWTGFHEASEFYAGLVGLARAFRRRELQRGYITTTQRSLHARFLLEAANTGQEVVPNRSYVAVMCLCRKCAAGPSQKFGGVIAETISAGSSPAARALCGSPES